MKEGKYLMLYRLNKRLISLDPNEDVPPGECYVEVMKKDDYWEKYNTLVQDHMLINSMNHAQYCKIDLLRSCNIGTFVIPDKKNLLGEPIVFGYFMERKRLIFIDDGDFIPSIMKDIEKNQLLEKTYVAHLFFEFLECLIKDDVVFLQNYEDQMMDLENAVMESEQIDTDIPDKLQRMRRELSKLSSYYTQLMNLSSSLGENYNNLMREEDGVMFRLFSDRVSRLVDQTKELKEYALQIREMHQTAMDEKQNNVISFLTIVTTIFMPLTLIAGWYGMNFKYMPELQSDHGYAICLGASIILILIEISYFRKKGWLKKRKTKNATAAGETNHEKSN